MISIKGVSFSYSDAPVLEGLNLEIGEGERVALMGHNGCGKSTLAMLIKGLIIPNEGSIHIDDLPVSEAPPGKVGIVFQNPEDQIAAATVEREVAFGLENIGLPREQMLARVDESLKRFGLGAYKRHPSHLLSGGQLQKLALAAAFAMRPDYLILDESTSMLDPKSRLEFMSALNSLPPKTGIIFITQFPREALNFERLIVMSAGRIIFDGSPEVFFADEDKTASANIDPPVEFVLKRMMGRL